LSAPSQRQAEASTPEAGVGPDAAKGLSEKKNPREEHAIHGSATCIGGTFAGQFTVRQKEGGVKTISSLREAIAEGAWEIDNLARGVR